MGTWGTIIFIIIALWGVISQLLEAAARKAKERKRIEEAQQRASRELGVTVQEPASVSRQFDLRDMPMPRGQRTVPHRPAPMPTPTPGHGPAQRPPTPAPQREDRAPARSGEHDLAARRREQIEQLRQRRVAELRTATGLGGTGAPPVGRPPGPIRTPQRKRGGVTGRQPQRPPQPVSQPQTVSYRSGRPLESPLEAVSEAIEAAADLGRRQQLAEEVAYTLPTPTAGQAIRTAQEANADFVALRKLLSDPRSLRQVFVAKELFDAPLALRE